MNLEEDLLKKFRETSEADELVLSDRTIKDTITLYGLPEEDKVDEFVEKLTPIFKTVAGQSRFVLSKAKEEKEKELERIKLESKDKSGVPQPNNDDTKGDMNEVLESLRKTIESQNAKFDSMNKELITLKTADLKKQIKSELEGYAKSKGLSDAYVLDKTLQSLNVEGENLDVELLKKELESTYTDEFKKCRGSEPTYGGSRGGSTDEDSEWEAFFKQKEEEAAYFKQKND